MVVCRMRHENCPANGETFASQTLQCINYWSLACKVGKRGGLEKYGQDMKNWSIHPNIVIIGTTIFNVVSVF